MEFGDSVNEFGDSVNDLMTQLMNLIQSNEFGDSVNGIWWLGWWFKYLAYNVSISGNQVIRHVGNSYNLGSSCSSAEWGRFRLSLGEALCLSYAEYDTSSKALGNGSSVKHYPNKPASGAHELVQRIRINRRKSMYPTSVKSNLRNAQGRKWLYPPSLLSIRDSGSMTCSPVRSLKRKYFSGATRTIVVKFEHEDILTFAELTWTL